MSKEYTFDMWERGRSISRIDGLSYDAAIEIARASSIAGRCTVSTDHNVMYNSKLIKGLSVIVFQNGIKTNEYLCDDEEID